MLCFLILVQRNVFIAFLLLRFIIGFKKFLPITSFSSAVEAGDKKKPFKLMHTKSNCVKFLVTVFSLDACCNFSKHREKNPRV